MGQGRHSYMNITRKISDTISRFTWKWPYGYTYMCIPLIPQRSVQKPFKINEVVVFTSQTPSLSQVSLLANCAK